MRWRGCWCGASPDRQGGHVLKQPGDASTQKVSLWRRFTNQAANAFAIGAAVLVIVPLVVIFVYLVWKGVGSLNWPSSRRPRNPQASWAGVWPTPWLDRL